MSESEIDTLLIVLDQAYDRPSWHGSNLRASLRGVGPELAAWRPGEGRNSIWDLVLHAAYWKYRVCRWIAAEPPASFGRPGSNFFALPDPPDAAAWRDDRELLDEWHRRLRAEIAAFDGDRLDERAGRDRWTYRDFINGIAAHDLYHAGQIQLLKKLHSE